MPKETVLCHRLGTTASQLQQWLTAHQTAEIADFLQVRFEERYFDPLQFLEPDYKNGFCTMAICCLTVEALESFHRGWPSSQRHTKAAFRGFLARDPRFTSLAPVAMLFYKNVRCGILHQGETSGGWKIRRSGPLFDPSTLTVNANRFHIELHRAVLEYTNELRFLRIPVPIMEERPKETRWNTRKL